jgi:hypothetical protein
MNFKSLDVHVIEVYLAYAGGAKNINFQELAADLAQITYAYPFEIPPYFGEPLPLEYVPVSIRSAGEGLRMSVVCNFDH